MGSSVGTQLSILCQRVVLTSPAMCSVSSFVDIVPGNEVRFGEREAARRLTKDLSPVSIKNLLNSFHPFGLMAIGQQYKVKFSTLARVRVGGAGYKTLAKIDRSRKYERVWVMMEKSRLPLDLWLGRGRPLNPYLRGLLINVLINEMRPKQLVVAPEDCFEQPGMNDFLEWSVLRNWVSQWLKYLKWYCIVSPIDRFFDAPVVETSWKIRRTC